MSRCSFITPKTIAEPDGTTSAALRSNLIGASLFNDPDTVFVAAPSLQTEMEVSEALAKLGVQAVLGREIGFVRREVTHVLPKWVLSQSAEALREAQNVTFEALRVLEEAAEVYWMSAADNERLTFGWADHRVKLASDRLKARLAQIKLALRVALRTRRTLMASDDSVVSFAPWLSTNGFHPPDSSLAAAIAD